MFQWSSSTPLDKIGYLGLRLEESSNDIRTLERYYEGTQPTAFLPADVAEQLQNRVRVLSVNYPRLVISSLVERLNVTGFRVDGAPDSDPQLWQAWQRNNMTAESDWVLRDALTLGRGYLSVWTDAKGNPTVTVESPHQTYAYRDPVTRDVLGVLKRWNVFDDITAAAVSYAVLYLPSEILSYQYAGAGGPVGVPASGWNLISAVPNPLGVVTVTEFTNRTNVLDFLGTSEFEPIIGLVDALNKVMLDSLAASDSAGFVRRWVTGLTIKVDDDGNPLQQFSQDKDSLWQAENPDAKFGEFQADTLASFDTQTQVLTRQIGAIAGLPDYLIGLNVANPNSADAIRAADLSLTTKAQSKTDIFGSPFARTAQLVKAIQTGRAVDSIQVTPIWGQIENRSESMATDSVSKLVAAGVPLKIAVRIMLGWNDDQLNQLPEENTND